MEAAGNVALFRDGYKLMRNLPPYGDTEWYLYNLTDDPGETKDMKEAEPERFAAMMREYEAYAASVGALEVPAGYEQMKQLTVNRLHGMQGQLVAAALVAAGILGGLVWLSLLGIRRLRRG
jgi:hypothetical protein